MKRPITLIITAVALTCVSAASASFIRECGNFGPTARRTPAWNYSSR